MIAALVFRADHPPDPDPRHQCFYNSRFARAEPNFSRFAHLALISRARACVSECLLKESDHSDPDWLHCTGEKLFSYPTRSPSPILYMCGRGRRALQSGLLFEGELIKLRVKMPTTTKTAPNVPLSLSSSFGGPLLLLLLLLLRRRRFIFLLGLIRSLSLMVHRHAARRRAARPSVGVFRSFFGLRAVARRGRGRRRSAQHILRMNPLCSAVAARVA